ncbi:uncharacterized protein LOC133735272 [Rosa rugosa]|uniref:uncharacterized protein LOC133735272 n=1 Tax=Rosa rugosa TaxID=74645 RepID=UPI002B403072|nr:uncharacterized protein LOC133735272 [Rosa rugosa]
MDSLRKVKSRYPIQDPLFPRKHSRENCNLQEGMEGNPFAKTMKNVSRGMAVLTVPFTMGFPKVLWLIFSFFHDVFCTSIFPVLFRIYVNKAVQCQADGFELNGTSCSLKPEWSMSSKVQFPRAACIVNLCSQIALPVEFNELAMWLFISR